MAKTTDAQRQRQSQDKERERQRIHSYVKAKHDMTLDEILQTMEISEQRLAQQKMSIENTRKKLEAVTAKLSEQNWLLGIMQAELKGLQQAHKERK